VNREGAMVAKRTEHARSFFCTAGERSQGEVYSGADRRSRRQRSGRSVHRRDAMWNISVPLMWKVVPAAEQREHDTALFLVKAQPAQGRFFDLRNVIGKRRICVMKPRRGACEVALASQSISASQMKDQGFCEGVSEVTPQFRN